MKSNDKAKTLKEKFSSVFNKKTEEQKIRYDEYMLMAAFLSEIERVQKQKDFKRNKLAEMIKISASYLTQVFRGDKPLNFHTIAKMQRVLNIGFSVKAYYKNDIVDKIFNGDETPGVNIFKFNESEDYTSYARSKIKTQEFEAQATSGQTINN